MLIPNAFEEKIYIPGKAFPKQKSMLKKDCQVTKETG